MARRLITAAVTAAGIAAAVALSGCGATRAISAEVDPVAHAATITAQAPGYRIAATLNVTSSAGSAHGTIDGAIETAQHTGAFTIREAGGGQEISMVEKVSGTKMYMNAPSQPVLQRLAGGKPWLRLDLARVMGVLGVGGMPTQGANPAQFVDYLRAVGAKTTRVGTETIGGSPTTRYHVAIDLDKYPTLSPPAQRATVARGIANMETVIGSHTLPVDVWIDAHKLVRRMSFAFNECVQDQHLTLAMTMNLSDYGQQAVPAMPSPAQTYDVTPLLVKAMKSVRLTCSPTA